MKPAQNTISELLDEFERQIEQAMNHQLRLVKEVEVAQAKCETVGEYRVKLMDMRDKLRAQVATESENQPMGQFRSNVGLSWKA
jgi:hypothetical protein